MATRAEWSRTLRFAAVLVAATGFFAGAASAAEEERPLSEAERVRFFETEIRPILQKHCAKCHTGEKPKGGLSLMSRAALLAGGDTGPAISVEKPDESLLLSAINYRDYEMPPSGKLPQPEIDLLTRWVRLGAPWTPGEPAALPEKPHDAAPAVTAETKAFWAFQPVRRPPVPAVSDPAWSENPIDAFVHAKLAEAGLRPNPPADKVTLLRRATYDLLGLPPSPAEVAEFVADESPDAWERLIDRLLASPHYGEKWGRHWLDLVRYAETNSYERDGIKPNAWRYRDYVIQSLNADKPYDQFVREQLAGDELPERTHETLIATGYYRLGIWDDEPVDPEQALYDDLDDILATTSQVFLGLTVNCARCHDHKLDPIPQRDYYRLLAFFNGLNRFGVRSQESVEKFSLRSIAAPEEEQKQAAEIAAHKQRVEENAKQIAAIEAIVRDDFVPVEVEEFRDERARIDILKKRVPRLLSQEKFDEYLKLMKQRDELRRFRPTALDMALCVTEVGPKPRDTHVLVRGNPHVRGDKVEPGFPEVLSPPEPVIIPAAEKAETSGRRLALAKWLTSPENPLFARVMVNRVWQYHFGRGLVRSPNDFGLQGTPPTHPELLDWLASEFVAGGWRLKTLHRQIMLSRAYRMSSQGRADALARDAENDLLWRFEMRRLTAEEVRDSILAVNGSLNLDKMFGPSMYPIIPQEVLAGQSRPGAGWGSSSPQERNRRSIYIHVKRSLMTPIIASFDGPEPDFSCPVRFASTQPTQALGMLNSTFINEEARVFADYVRKHAGNDPAEQVRLCLMRTLQREPTETDIRRGLALMDSLAQEHKVPPADTLRYFCLVALNLNEFLYLD